MAVSDKTRARQRTVFQRRKTAYSGGLHSLRLRKYARRFYERQNTDYSEKLTEIIATNDIKSVTVVRMEVPCCGGLEAAAKKALQASGKFIPWQVVTLSLDGKIKDN